MPFAAGKMPVPAGRRGLPAGAGSGHFTAGHGELWGCCGDRGGARPCGAQPAGRSAGMRWDSQAQTAPSPWERHPTRSPDARLLCCGLLSFTWDVDD